MCFDKGERRKERRNDGLYTLFEMMWPWDCDAECRKKRWFNALSLDFSGPGFGKISTQMVKSTLKGLLGRMALVDPCFEDLITACVILNSDSNHDRDIKI